MLYFICALYIFTHFIKISLCAQDSSTPAFKIPPLMNLINLRGYQNFVFPPINLTYSLY